MTKYLEAEKRLAELLGWTRTQTRCDGEACWATESDPDCNEIRLANWCRDDAAAFRLMVEHTLRVHANIAGYCRVVWAENAASIMVWYKDHPDQASAVRYAIVQAVIAKLEQKHENQNIRADWPRT